MMHSSKAGVFTVALIIFFLSLSGCASMNTFSERDIRNGVWSSIRASGVNSDARHTLFFDKIETTGKANFFSPDDEKVTYWAHFKQMSFISPYQVTFNSRWYDPAGNLFFEDQFPLTNVIDAAFVKTSIPIHDSPARYSSGIWQVELYYQGHLIDKRKFHIVAENDTHYDMKRTAAPVSDKVSELWDRMNQKQAGNTAKEDAVPVRALFQEAQSAFNEGNLGKAQQTLEEVLKQAPYKTEAHVGLTAIYCKLKNWEAALKELEYVLQRPDYRDQAIEIRNYILEQKQEKK